MATSEPSRPELPLPGVAWLAIYAVFSLLLFYTNGFYKPLGPPLMLGVSILLVWQALDPSSVGRIVERVPDRLRSMLLPGLLVLFALLNFRPPAIYVRSWEWNIPFCAVAAASLPFALSYASVPTRPSRRHAWVVRHRLAALIALAILARLYLLVASPAPVIDVWTALQGGADALLGGRNPYAEQMRSPYPSVSEVLLYPYPPIALLVTTPFRWLFGDVRMAMVVCDVLGSLCVRQIAIRALTATSAVGPPRPVTAELLALLFLFHPRALFILEQSWIEPISALLFAAVLLSLQSRRLFLWAAWTGLFLVSKQYLLLLAPIFLVAVVSTAGATLHQRVRLIVTSAAPALVVTLPFVLWNPRAFVDGTVWSHVVGLMNVRALTVPYWLHERLGIEVSLAVSAVTAIAACAFATAVYRPALRSPASAPSAAASASAVALLVSLPFQSQAYPNYYYLGGVMLLFAAATSAGASREPGRIVAKGPPG